MIKNWKQRELLMDFSSMYDDSNHPSDIDLFYIGQDKEGHDVLIVGEIKQSNGTLRNGQRHLLEKFVEKYNGSAIILYITHHADVARGDHVVNVANCRVEEYYYRTAEKKGRWVYPREPLTVREVIDTYRVEGERDGRKKNDRQDDHRQ